MEYDRYEGEYRLQILTTNIWGVRRLGTKTELFTGNGKDEYMDRDFALIRLYEPI